jgi:hypothetical protein
MRIRQYTTLFLFLFAGLCAAGQKLPQYRVQVAGIPLKLMIRPSAKTVGPNQNVKLVVSLLDGDGKPAKARERTKVRITVTEPNGRKVRLSETIDKGDTADTQSYTPRTPGRYTILAEDEADALLSDLYSFYVLPVPVRRGASLYRFDATPAWLLAKPPPPPPPQPPPAGRPRVFLEFLARAEGVLSDGKDAATIAATYISSDGAPAPSDIHVWLRRSHGDFDAKPLVIKQGEYEGRVLWTSQWPVKDATVEFVSVTAGCVIEGPRSFQTSFIRQVDGIRPIGPPSFSLTEHPQLTVWFVDHTGQLIKVDKRRTVTFSARDTGIIVTPSEAVVDPGGGPVTVKLTPVSLGQSVVQIDSEGLRSGSTTYSVNITVGWLIAIAMLGGLVGGCIAFAKERTARMLKVIGGIAGGFVLTSVYVFGAVPLATALPINPISVTVVSLIGGYSGTKVLDWAWGKLGA